MPPEMINIALTIPLRDLIAAQAEVEGTTQDRMADTLLLQQIEDAENASERGESLAERYLTHPRLAERGDRATLNIARTTNERAGALARAVAQVTGQRVPKTRMIQGLLWDACDPVPASARQPLPPPAEPRATVTVGIALDLNTQISAAALQHGTTREALAAMLLDQVFAGMDDQPALARDLADEPLDSHATSTATIQVARAFDPRIQLLADQQFDGVKARALQALLVYGLRHLEPPNQPIADTPDRAVSIDGALYTRVAHLALALRAEQGQTITIRDLVERAVRKDVERAEARMQKKGATDDTP